MSTLEQLRDTVEGILEADEVTRVSDAEYRVTKADEASIRICRNDRGEWGCYFESGLAMPYAPTHARPNELVVWALL